MFRIAEEIAKKEKAKALITGENLAQVASQTLENIRAIEDVVDLPVIRPLITYDKQEIINLAKKIGSFETSIIPHDDCCSLFVPKHPATKSELKRVEFEESKLAVKKLVEEALDKTEKKMVELEHSKV